MSSVNKVIIIGSVGKDAEVRYMPDGSGVANLNVATNTSWKDKNTGERREDTEWHRVVVYGKSAEFAGSYIKKGRTVYVEGRLKTRKWQDQSGADRYTTEIVADRIELIGGTGGGQQANSDQSGSQEGDDSGNQRNSSPAKNTSNGASKPASSAPRAQAPASSSIKESMREPAMAGSALTDDIPFRRIYHWEV